MNVINKVVLSLWFAALCHLFILVAGCNRLDAQVFPKEGSKLHYRRICFILPVTTHGTDSKVEIAAGYVNNEDSFLQNIIVSGYCTLNKTILDVPAFGADYTWRSVDAKKGAAGSRSAFHHFSTAASPVTDTSQIRFRILKPAEQYKDHYVFVDGNNALYDMNGNVIWYMPATGNLEHGTLTIRDLKATPQGTITFLHNKNALEINYYGDTLWEAPGSKPLPGQDSEYYHHEFTRLTNGHYMVLGNEPELFEHKLPRDSSSSPGELVSATGKTIFGTVIEYNAAGNKVWSWNSFDYFKGSDLRWYIPETSRGAIDVHENSFFFDERDSIIYISFRNISRILKVKYPSGNVIASYGEVFRPGVMPEGNGLFCDQHGIRRSKDGYLYLFNNNGCDKLQPLPSVIMMREPGARSGSLEKIWEYRCSTDGINIDPSMKKNFEKKELLAKMKMRSNPGPLATPHLTTGGNVLELPDGSMFVCMNSQFNKMFIVNRNRQILWSAVPERKSQEGGWHITSEQYRAYIISRDDLDKLILNAAR
jgi:hypothetical protein